MREIDLRDRLVFKTQRGRIDEEAGTVKYIRQGLKLMRFDTLTESVGKHPRLFKRPVQYMDAAEPALEKGDDHGSAGPSRTINHRRFQRLPARALFIEIGREAISVGIRRLEPTVFAPERVGRSDVIRRLVRLIGKRKSLFLVRNCDIAAHIIGG